EHLVTTGIAYLNQSGISFDISYGYNFWNLSWYHRDFGGSISEVHSSHRVTASFALRY
ncbi:MAG: hypothetical protein GY870_21675, partial [archaeon]|nr:hypothetical protein [archaeon]